MSSSSLKSSTRSAFNIPQAAKARMAVLVKKIATQRVAEMKESGELKEGVESAHPLRNAMRKAFSR